MASIKEQRQPFWLSLELFANMSLTDGKFKDLDQLDEIEKGILLYLCKIKETPSIRTISEKTGHSRNACRKRINSLIKNYISNISIALCDEIRENCSIHFISVELKKNNNDYIEKFENILHKIPMISDFFHVNGDWDYLIKFNSSNFNDQKLFLDLLKDLPFIVDSQVIIATQKPFSTKFHEIDGFLYEGDFRRLLSILKGEYSS